MIQSISHICDVSVMHWHTHTHAHAHAWHLVLLANISERDQGAEGSHQQQVDRIQASGSAYQQMSLIF